MARRRKVSDRDLARMRHLSAEGWSYRDLAVEFGISRQHVGRLLRGDQRPTIGVLDAEAVRSGVAHAVATFLAGAELDPGDEVLAATARALAAKLDAATASDSAAAAQVVPRLSAQLVDVLERLRVGVPAEPDGIDSLQRRRAARRLALAATNGTGEGPE